jgi:hypothetical protein
MAKVEIIPKFDADKIVDETLKAYWEEIQLEFFELAEQTLDYMQNYISSNTHRGSTGNLAKSITLYKDPNTVGQIHWGIGDLEVLQTKAPYWYVVNFGKYVNSAEDFIPGKSKGATGTFVPGFFGEGNGADSSQKGSGSEYFTKARGVGMGMYPGPIRPINYIEATVATLEKEVDNLLKKFGSSAGFGS